MKKKFSLNREAIRNLTDKELGEVAGGTLTGAYPYYPSPIRYYPSPIRYATTANCCTITKGTICSPACSY